MRFLSPRLPLTVIVFFGITASANASTDYYVSPTGNDANAGTSAAQPWQSLNRLNLMSFAPGDRILLEGGVTHNGTLTFDTDDGGTAASPVVITSYGSGRATINAGTGSGIRMYNTAGFKIVNLSLVTTGRATNAGSGISAYTDRAGDVKLPLIHIESVNVSGFGYHGIEIVGGNGASGFERVTIKFVAAWDNRMSGIMTFGTLPYAHRNVYVGYSKSFNNPGMESPDSTGNGIVLGAVDGGWIERSVASGNGTSARGVHGPIGIWTYHSNNVHIQFNEAFNNRTGGWADGGGFGLDVGVTNSTMQYNYSHGNDGTGLLLAGGFDPNDHANNLVRYNVSENDGRRNGFGAIQIWGRTRNTHIYNNTVFTTTDSSGQARAVNVTNAYAEAHFPVNVSFRNNIFYVVGSIPHVIVGTTVLRGGSLRFEKNNYFATSGQPRILWGGTSYTSLAAWAHATSQESGPSGILGSIVDPMLGSPGGGITLNDATRLTSMTAYRLRHGSPMIDTGLSLGTLGLPVDHDYYEIPAPQGARADVGAHEWTADTGWAPAPEVVMYATDASFLSGSWSFAADSTAAAGTKLTTPDAGWSNTSAPLASPTHYVEFTFNAQANTRYRFWMRMRARGDSKLNDAVFVQFSGAINASSAPAYRIGTTTGLTVNLWPCADCQSRAWGWQNRAYWLSDTGDVWFATSGPQTVRIQVREDGVEFDQVVLSPSQHLTNAPGAVSNDTTIVPKGSEPPPPPPNVAPTVSLTSPSNGASFTAPATITIAAAANDSDGHVARVDFLNGATLIGSDSSAPHAITWTGVAAGSYELKAIATDNAGASTTSSPVKVTVTAPPPASAPEIVIYAGDISQLREWTRADDPAAAGGSLLTTADAGWSNTTGALAAPARYFDATFTAQGQTRYRVWLRLRAKGDSKWNDSVFVQFSDAINANGNALYRIGTTGALTVNLATCSTCALSGWGWQNRAYWLADTGEVWFPSSGTRTLRVQVREDGVELDQIVISPAKYLTSPPGPVKNDSTIVPKP